MNPQYLSLQALYIWEAFLLTLQQNVHHYLSTEDLKSMGYQHPSQLIHYLKKKKRIRIKTIYEKVTKAKGNRRKGNASYRLDTGV
jgi:signal-transduction protein with cAMP-binding, CBS, and nucleotidyltransferase domain